MDQFKDFINSFSPISDEEYELITPVINRMRIKKNAFILERGQVCSYVYFVESGFFRMYYVDHDAHEINCQFSEENSFISDFQSFHMQKPSQYYLQAMQDSEIIAIKHEDIHRIYLISCSWERFGRCVAEQICLQIKEREEMLHFQSPEERYQTLLNTRPQLFNQVSQQYLSSYIGIKPESLSRLRRRLHRK